MKRKFTLALILFCFSPWAKGIELKVCTKQFLDQDLNPYLEIQYKIPSESLKFTTNENGKFQAAAKIVLHVSQGDNELLSLGYPLFSQELDNLDLRFDLTDIKRVNVGSGIIKISVWAMDYLTGKADSSNFELLYKKPYLSSDLVLIDKYFFLKNEIENSHGNIFTIPKITAEYTEFTDTINLYLETYQKAGNYSLMVFDKDKNLTYMQDIEHTEGKIKRHIIRLPKLKIGSGNLFINLNTEQGEKLQEIEIFVPKPEDRERFMALNTWELKHYFLWIEPLAGIATMEKLFGLLSESDSTLVKEAFFEFWKASNESFPWQAWVFYQLEIDYVNKTFGMTNMAGFKTDRGRVFLQYGRPFDIIEFHDNPQTYPYEIWQYANDGKMGNSKFYFVNYSFTLNNFTLAHSTALGEPQNPNWRNTIDRGNQRNSNNRNIGTGWENEFINE